MNESNEHLVAELLLPMHKPLGIGVGFAAPPLPFLRQSSNRLISNFYEPSFLFNASLKALEALNLVLCFAGTSRVGRSFIVYNFMVRGFDVYVSNVPKPAMKTARDFLKFCSSIRMSVRARKWHCDNELS
jgi:hypothetical protein